MKNKELILDWIGDVNEMLDKIGPWLTIIILLIILIIFMVIFIARSMKSLSDSVDRLADKVSSPYLNTGLSLKLFHSVMSDHVTKKLNYLGGVLRANSIQTRRKQIEKNIEREFKRITAEEAGILSEYKSVCGDMGKILNESINWKSFLEKVYAVFFTDDQYHLKIQDIKSLMNGIVNDLAKKIEENGVHN